MPRLRFRLASAAALCALPALAAAQGQPSFGTYVSIGDSLAAGFESGGLVQTHQVNSVPALLARQAAAPDFQLPLVSEPGIPPELTLVSLVPAPTIVRKPGQGAPLNLGLPRPYNNLAVPGATLIDAVTRVTDNGGLHDLILRGRGTQLQQALALRPTFATVWIGNNDVLGAAGHVPFRRHFVGGLVIIVGRVGVVQGSPARFPALDHVDAVRGVEHRDAELGEVQMVGAVEVACLRV